MTDPCRFLAAHGPMLFFGATGLLALGWLGMAVHRAPVHRQRAGELAILGVLAWLVLAVVPLPRLSLGELSLGPVAENTGWDEANVGWDEAERSPTMSPRRWWSFAPSYGFADRKGGTVDDSAGAPQAAEIDAPRPQSPTRPSIGHLPTVQSQASPGLWAGLTPREPLPQRARANAPPPSALSFPLWAPSPVRGDADGSAEADPPIDWGYLLAAVYAAGSIGCVAWLALGRMLLWRVSSTAAQPPMWLERLSAEVAPGQRRRPRLLVSGRSGRAFSFGLWRATIVLPAGICLPRSSAAIRHLLAHELAHVRRRDSLGRLVFNLAFPLLYFHPLYWLLRGGVALAAEMIADDEAAGRGAMHSYVVALVALARERQPRRLAVLSSHGLFGSPSQFYRRMKMLLTRKTRLAACCSWRWRFFSAALCVVAVAAMAAIAGAQPAQAPKADASAKQTPPEKAANSAPSQEAAAFRPKDNRWSDRRTIITYDLHGASPAQLERLGGVVSGLSPGAELRFFREAGSMVVTLAPKDAEKVDQAVALFKELLSAGPSAAGTRPVPSSTTSPIKPAGPPSVSLPLLSSVQETQPAARAPVAVQPPTVKAAEPPAWPVPGPPIPSSAATPRFTSDAQRFPTTFPKRAPEDAAPVQMPIASPRLDSDVAAGRPAAEGSQLDLVNLANSYTDAMANLKMASLHHARLQQLQKSAAVSSEEVEIAAIKLDAAQRKVDLLRSIAQSALRTSETELQVLHQLHKAGTQPSGVGPLQLEVPRVEGRLEILKRILESPGPGKTPTKY